MSVTWRLHKHSFARHRRRRPHDRHSRWTVLVPLILALIGIITAFAFIAREASRNRTSTGPAELRLRLPVDPSTLDPARASDGASIAVVAQVFDGLVELDPGDGEPRPSLAAAWDVSSDGKAYTFHLRPGSRFHNGREIDASDVVYSFERLLSPELRSERRWVLSKIRGAEAYSQGRSPRVSGLRATGPLSVTVSLDSPYGPFLALLSLEAASILPREVYADAGEAYLQAPVGAGPFRFVSWEPGSRISLAQNADHFAGSPAVAGIVYRIIPSDAAALDEYLAGGIDVLDEIPGGRRADMRTGRAGEFRHGARPATAFVGFNHARAPFKGNRALRQAFNYAVDRESLCRAIQEGREIPAAGILPPGTAGHDSAAPGYTYDPGKARDLLAQAGYPGGRGLPEFALGHSGGDAHRKMCLRIQSDLSAIGVKVTPREYESGALLRAVSGGEEPGSELLLFGMAWLAEYPDPDAFLTPTLHSTSPPYMGNFGRYANARLDALLDRARAASDPAQRLRLYREAEREAVDDAAWLFLYHYGDDALVKPYVKNLVLPAFGELLAPLHKVSLDVDHRLAGM